MGGERSWVGAAVLGAGIALGGWFIGHGWTAARTVDRYVSVKGVAEREVTADLALWPFQIVATGNDLGRTQVEIDRSVQAILGFLARHGVDTAEAELQGLQVTDRLAQDYREGPDASARFVVQQLMMVRSQSPATVQAASQRMGELVGAGVVLQSGSGWGPARPVFLFRNLNEIKPAMIAEATAAARAAAQEFARDSESRLGGIRQANQGVFVILPRDQAPGVSESDQLQKTVRVVSTIDYNLRD
jgi:hypothetical protein